MELSMAFIKHPGHAGIMTDAQQARARSLEQLALMVLQQLAKVNRPALVRLTWSIDEVPQ